MTMSRPVCLLAFLLYRLIFVAAAPLDSPLYGGFEPIENIRDPNLRLMAEFAISQYNTCQCQSQNYLVFQNLVQAESQLVQGTNWRLVIAAVNQSSPSPRPPQNYEALVFVDLWETQKELVSFKLGNEILDVGNGHQHFVPNDFS